jgi:hypothetical protein
LDYWTSITRGARNDECALALRSVAQGIMASPEFLARWSDTASRVDRLYLTLLHRHPDDGGRNYWISRADSVGDWRTIVSEFAWSDEATSRQLAICQSRPFPL